MLPVDAASLLGKFEASEPGLEPSKEHSRATYLIKKSVTVCVSQLQYTEIPVSVTQSQTGLERSSYKTGLTLALHFTLY